MTCRVVLNAAYSNHIGPKEMQDQEQCDSRTKEDKPPVFIIKSQMDQKSLDLILKQKPKPSSPGGSSTVGTADERAVSYGTVRCTFASGGASRGTPQESSEDRQVQVGGKKGLGNGAISC